MYFISKDLLLPLIRPPLFQEPHSVINMHSCTVFSQSLSTHLSAPAALAHFPMYLVTVSVQFLLFTFQSILFCSQ